MAGIITGNVQSLAVLLVTFTPVAVAANTTAEQNFTVPGVLASDACIKVTKTGAQAGLGICNSRVSGNNTIAVTFMNLTAAAITPTAAEFYRVTIARPDSTQSGFSV